MKTWLHRMDGKKKGLMAALALCLPWNATAVSADRPSRLEAFMQGTTREVEQLLVKSLLEITDGRLDAALKDVDAVIRAMPNFKLAYLIRGDLLQAKARQIDAFGSVPEADHEEIADLQHEAKVRLEHYLMPQGRPEIAADYLWQLDSSQQNAMVVDTAKSRMYLYRNEGGQARFIADYYVTVGKNGIQKQKEGDKKTPLGVYFTGSRLAQEKLPDLYGSAAYPLNYPNEWDIRQGKSGHGIWMHGTPRDTYSRPPRASDGCVVLTNQDINSLETIFRKSGIPVVIASSPAPESAADQKRVLLESIERWRKDWESQQTDVYLSHYSQDFFADNMNFERWASEKKRIQSLRPKVSVVLSEVSIFRYPDSSKKMAVVTFNQDFKADHLKNKMRKRQYWVLEHGRWKIMYEGAA